MNYKTPTMKKSILVAKNTWLEVDHNRDPHEVKQNWRKRKNKFKS